MLLQFDGAYVAVSARVAQGSVIYRLLRSGATAWRWRVPASYPSALTGFRLPALALGSCAFTRYTGPAATIGSVLFKKKMLLDLCSLLPMCFIFI